ncbi:hypothetical protein G7046_g7896 [Stylonectria norvegica]|nr:hypothetical protein G7046_g7896 [Stylonectria norvegica]
MRFTPASAASAGLILLSGHALAADITSNSECLANNAIELVDAAECGPDAASLDRASIVRCFQQLQTFEPSDVSACYAAAGCSSSEAEKEAGLTLSRCQDISREGDLRKRYPGVFLPRADATTAAAASKASGSRRTGTDCFTTGRTSTTSCITTTSKGVEHTGSCVPTEVTTSSCAPGLLCTLDTAGTNICMDKHDGLETSGIVVAIVFGLLITAGVTTLTFLCCKDRKQQKRMVAKAEATALVRAATKKQKTREARPLMSRNPSGGSNPFQDQARP